MSPTSNTAGNAFERASYRGLPAYTDRKEIWTLDGDAIRWLGVVLFAAGGALRIWPVFVLGRRTRTPGILACRRAPLVLGHRRASVIAVRRGRRRIACRWKKANRIIENYAASISGGWSQVELLCVAALGLHYGEATARTQSRIRISRRTSRTLTEAYSALDDSSLEASCTIKQSALSPNGHQLVGTAEVGRSRSAAHIDLPLQMVDALARSFLNGRNPLRARTPLGKTSD